MSSSVLKIVQAVEQSELENRPPLVRSGLASHTGTGTGTGTRRITGTRTMRMPVPEPVPEPEPEPGPSPPPARATGPSLHTGKVGLLRSVWER